MAGDEAQVLTETRENVTTTIVTTTTTTVTETSEEPEAAKALEETPMGNSGARPTSPVSTSQESRTDVHKLDYEKDIVYLYQFSRTPVIPSVSPFCLKVETWLRVLGIKYENVDHKIKFRSKKGQLPFIEYNGEEIADSAIIIKELGLKFGKDLDEFLTPEQKVISHMTMAMIENHLFWCVYSQRTRNPGQFLKMSKMNIQQMIGSKIPAGLLNLFFKMKFKQGAKRVRAHGIGVHKPEEIEEFARSDLKDLSTLLGDKPFYFGEKLTLLDIVSFSFTTQIIYMDSGVPYPLREWFEENAKNLIAHCNRIKERYYPDWDEMCKTMDLNTHIPKPKPEENDKAKEVTEEVKEEEKSEPGANHAEEKADE